MIEPPYDGTHDIDLEHDGRDHAVGLFQQMPPPDWWDPYPERTKAEYIERLVALGFKVGQ